MNTRFTNNYLSLMISSLLLLPAMTGHAAETTLVSVDSAGQQGNTESYFPSISADGRYVAFQSWASNFVANDTNDDGSEVFVHDRFTGTITHISVNSAGSQGNAASEEPNISANGRFVTFWSEATNLVEGDTNNSIDIFVHDRTTGITSRVSVSSTGEQSNGYSNHPTISADGRFVAFWSEATNLVAGNFNPGTGIYVHDRITGATTRVDVSSTGEQSNSYNDYPAISADGRFVTFTSEASNLVAGDTNGTYDIFVHDRVTGITSRVSVSSTGVQGNSSSFSPPTAISANGRFVAFISSASNLVTGDTNEQADVFVHDRSSGTTSRVSVSSTGEQSNNYYYQATISADGRFVAFQSEASNLVAGDTNGLIDIFVHDRITSKTTRVSVNSVKEQGNSNSERPAISADGRWVAFDSEATNLVATDTNEVLDTFIHDRQLNTAKTADLGLAVTSQPASAQTGQTASYTYTLTNNGPDNISSTAVKLTDIISNGDVVSLTPSQGGCSKAAVSVCNLGSLASGASVTLTAEIKAGSDPLTQQLSVNAPPVDNVPDNNSITVSTPVTP